MEIGDSLTAEFAELRGKDGFKKALSARETVKRGLMIAAIVGTVLIVINQGDAILAGSVPPVWKIVLTYFVPYCVSTYSTATFKVALAKRMFCEELAQTREG